MKIYTDQIDWCDEGDVFFFSLDEDENLDAMRELINIFYEHELLPDDIEMYWGTNECFNFSPEDLINFIDEAVDISDEEVDVFEKFEIMGFDIYEEIFELLGEILDENTLSDLSQETLDAIKPHYSQLFSPEDWDKIQQTYDKICKK